MDDIVVDPDISLRPYNPTLAPALFAVLDVNRAHLDPWISMARRTPTVDAMREQLTDLKSRQGEGLVDGGTIVYRDAVVGDTRLDGQYWDDAGHALSLSYWISEEYEGHGIVTRACRELVTRAFSTPGVERVEISAAAHNRRSGRVAERLGFQFEGILRKELKVGDEVHDLAVYSMLADEWAKVRAITTATESDHVV